MSEESNQKLQKFVTNHELGSLPEEIKKNLYDFIIQTHRDGIGADAESFRKAMEDKGFDEVLISEYITAFFTGRGILKRYEETSKPQ